MNTTTHSVQELIDQLQQLNLIGIALSKEKDTKQLLKQILFGAVHLTHSDGGTIYTINDHKEAEFAYMYSKTLGIHPDDVLQKKPDPIPLYTDNGEPNEHMAVVYAALNNITININDVYAGGKFDVSGSKKVDRELNYRTKSMLTIPLCDQENTVIGVLQLINALSETGNEIITFTEENQLIAESLASQAAITLTNQRLIADQKDLFEAFIKVIAAAIDEKSPYTSKHCFRVPELALLLAKAVNDSDQGVYQDVSFSEDDFYELKIAAWLHDCGKVTTPEHVIDKSTKLETIYDRMETVSHRFELLKCQKQIDSLQRQLSAAGLEVRDDGLSAELQKLDEDRDFLKTANIGGEYMPPNAQTRVKNIGKTLLSDSAQLLTENEIHNLCVPKGTLTSEERLTINHHIVVTQDMLKKLPYPKYLSNVIEIAGNHHERADGAGYPNGLKQEEMSLRARIMCIADVFEALTAADRPYKLPKTLTESLGIIDKMNDQGHFDKDLVNLFVQDKVYLQYAHAFLSDAQIDSEG